MKRGLLAAVLGHHHSALPAFAQSNRGNADRGFLDLEAESLRADDRGN